MIAEKAFTDKEEKALQSMRLRIEMAVATEWVIRDDDDPDHLQLVYVAPTDSPDELQAACSCDDGKRDLPCPHALGVFKQIREQDHILEEILSRRPPAVVG